MSWELLESHIVDDSLTHPDTDKPDVKYPIKADNIDYTRYQQELERVHRELNEMMLQQVSANIQQLSEVLTDIIQQNLELVAGLVQVANRVGPGAQFNNLASTVPLLGSALDFSA